MIAAIEQQQGDPKFVLDTVLIENDNSAPLAAYWDDYKLQVVLGYMHRFGEAVGINLPHTDY